MNREVGARLEVLFVEPAAFKLDVATLLLEDGEVGQSLRRYVVQAGPAARCRPTFVLGFHCELLLL
jgi:hypothetical protein